MWGFGKEVKKVDNEKKADVEKAEDNESAMIQA